MTPSHLLEYLYCPRFTYYEYVLCIPQHEEKSYKVIKGREIHDDKLEENKEYLRKRIGVKEKYLDRYLSNDLLRGVVDEVLLLEDDTMAPLDYKFAVYDDIVYKMHFTQLVCYAWLIEENFGRKVNKGFLVFVRSKNKLVEVPITEVDKTKVKRCAKEIQRIIGNNYFPKATGDKSKCNTCTYQNICPR